MDEHDVAQPSAEDEDQGEFEVTGREARARWRQVRLQFHIRVAVAPGLLIAAVLLFLAGTSTEFGRRLASIFDAVQTLHDAGESAGSIALAPLTVPLFIIILLIMAVFGVGLVGTGIAQLFRFAIRGFKPRPGEESGLTEFSMGIAILGMLALMVYSLVHYRDLYLDMLLGPLRTVWGWFQ